MTLTSRVPTPADSRIPAVALDFAFPWAPDLGNGRCQNPIIYADYSDPDVIRVGQDFYLVASSFNCTPGLPILHSKDLVNWTIIAHALTNLPHPRYKDVAPGCGVWAPSIRFHAGKYWIFFPTPDEGIYVVTADHPAGKWSEPHLLQAGRGLIDPCPFWDDDGQAYLAHAYAASRAGIKHRLRVCPMAPDGSRLLGEGQIVFHQPRKHPTLEGPKFYKRDGWYYLLAPAGGVETGWQVALRSKNVYGPYEDKIVLSQGDTDINGPHQGALVDTAAGDWWFLHFQDAGVYGRVVHLQPVQWRDGWPIMGRNGEPVQWFGKPVGSLDQKPCAPQTGDEFDGGKLGLQWQWHANHSPDWHSLGAHRGWLRLYPQLARPALHEQPNLLLQKFPARTFSVETLLRFSPAECGEEAGLVVMGNAHAALGVIFGETGNLVVMRTNGSKRRICETASGEFKLRVDVQNGGKCCFSFEDHGKVTAIPWTFQAAKGKWLGAKVGLYCIKQLENSPSGHADFDYFRFG